ncbi:MAG: hypothetical protein AAGF10_03295 [Verrucomicrobiota bacterium]
MELPTPSFAFIGMFVATAAALLTLWFKHRRVQLLEQERDERQQGRYEPKADPPLHKEYFTRKEGEFMQGEVCRLEEKLEEVDDERRKSVSRCYDNMRNETAAMRDELKGEIDEMDKLVASIAVGQGKLQEAVSTLKQTAKEHSFKLDTILQRLPRKDG